MSVERSIAKFISAQVSEFGSRVYIGNNPDLDLEAASLPFCVVNRLPGFKETVSYIGDQARQVECDYQIDVYAGTYENMVDLETKVRLLLRTAQGQELATDSGSTNVGIDLYGMDQLMSTADLLTYTSGQNNWFTSPAPVIYKNNSVITTGFTINYVNGTVTFLVAQLSSDKIRATYKCGLIDLEEMSVLYETPTVETRPYYSAFITVKPFIYFKDSAQKFM